MLVFHRGAKLGPFPASPTQCQLRQLEQHIGLPSSSGGPHTTCSLTQCQDNSSSTLVFRRRAGTSVVPGITHTVSRATHWSSVVERRTAHHLFPHPVSRQLEQHIGLPSSSGHISCSRHHPHSVNLDNSSNTLVFRRRAEDRTPLVPSPSVKTTRAAHWSSAVERAHQLFPASPNLDNSSNTLVFRRRAEDRTPLVPSPSVKTTQAVH